ncbi:MAG: DUF3109 family protein, partial [Sphingobacteriia bacterium]|nr:DUF3109 family protein [Sphingobacteriia bacterium]
DICQPACDTRNNGGIRMYEFLRVALERKYGSSWYNQLKEVASILPEQG